MTFTLSDWRELGRTLRLEWVGEPPAAVEVMVDGERLVGVDSGSDGSARDYALPPATSGTRSVEVAAALGLTIGRLTRARLLE
jgi:hypothetical protein